MKNKSLAGLAFEKLSAIRDDKSCKMCGKSAKEGCECDEEDMPENGMEEDMKEESGESEEGPEDEKGEEGEEKAPGVVINIALGKQWDKYRGRSDD